MLKSMTGFGRHESENGDYSCKAEVRSVNNRYIEINTRIPKSMMALEAALKKRIKSRCARGSFDLNISIEKLNDDAGDLVLQPNLNLASQYYQAFQKIQDHLGLKGGIDIKSLLTMKDMIQVEPLALDPSREELILDTVDNALSVLIKMREEEGENLQTDILARLDSIEKHGESIKTRQPEAINGYKERLAERIKVLTDGVEADPQRLAQETAIMADRCDVTEEIIRLESHIKQFRSLLETKQPMGRKLEFLIQEINRETNTIGSKTIDSEVSQMVIEIKSDLEKIREQLQNIE
ncbi:MAG: YicC family protein [Nitrospinae bacterium]|nr:YicC family protein [Nitrospinota bacterium]MDA1108580.1 YicC family protein [Nitrospinota bacterium]